MKRFSLSREERIKSRTLIRGIFERGELVVSGSRLLRALYISTTAEGNIPFAMAPAVSRKAGNAVWRNRVKRVLREAYRLNKEEITEHCRAKGLDVRAIISPHRLNKKSGPEITLALLEPEVKSLLKQVSSRLA